ncbi:MAG: FHA domain-containing protein [Planctomycetota bacterium]|nr:MAG: FHA domain-containing protein [Planctomycetota bacterium]
MLSYLKLTGIDGLCKGEEFFIRQGESALIGRSSQCQICLSHTKRALKLDQNHPKDKIKWTKFRTVDGKHLKIHFYSNDKILLENTSKNGTYLNGEKLPHKYILTNLQQQPATLLLGLEETFRLELLLEASSEKPLSTTLHLTKHPTLIKERPKTEEILIQDIEELEPDNENLEIT